MVQDAIIQACTNLVAQALIASLENDQEKMAGLMEKANVAAMMVFPPEQAKAMIDLIINEIESTLSSTTT